MIVHSHCVQNFEDFLLRYVGEGSVAKYCEKKNTFYSEHPAVFTEKRVFWGGNVTESGYESVGE